MVKRKKDPLDRLLDPDAIADAVEGKLDRVKVSEITDAAFKGGVWVSTVLGTKFMLDLLTKTELFSWVKENPHMADTALKSYLTMNLTGGFWPADIARVYSEYFKSEPTQKELEIVAAAIDEDNRFGLWGFGKRDAQVKVLYNPLLLAKITILGHDKVSELIKRYEAEKEAKANAEQYWKNQLESRKNEYEGYMLQIAEFGHGSLSSSERDRLAILEGHGAGSIDEAEKKIQEAIDAAAAAMDADAALKAAEDKAFDIMKWAIALVIGTYLAGSLIYAGDTLLDCMKSMFEMFKLPFKGVV